MPTLYEQILNKPKSYRRKIAFALTGLIGVFVVAIWLVITTFSMQKAFNFGKNPGEEDEPTTAGESIEKSAPSFHEEKEQFESLGEDFGNFFSGEAPAEDQPPTQETPSEIDYSELEDLEE